MYMYVHFNGALLLYRQMYMYSKSISIFPSPPPHNTSKQSANRCTRETRLTLVASAI